MDIPENPFGGYDKWPGYIKVKNRLEALLAVLANNPRGFFVIWFRAPDQTSVMSAFSAENPVLVTPKSKQEFESSGHVIRLAFDIKGEQSQKLFEGLRAQPFAKAALGEVMLCAHSGPSNNLAAVYRAMHMNVHMLAQHPGMANQLHIAFLEDRRFEIGFDACGNIFDSLLLSDEIRLTPRSS